MVRKVEELREDRKESISRRRELSAMSLFVSMSSKQKPESPSFDLAKWKSLMTLTGVIYIYIFLIIIIL